MSDVRQTEKCRGIGEVEILVMFYFTKNSYCNNCLKRVQFLV